jgi:pimeloyl-ACP methyl ester carboxylesterase
VCSAALVPLDHQVPTPAGRLFARAWGNWRGPVTRPPIVLFHDSLGCVDVWRTFPDALAAATGHGVIAYDRLGFGRSDPHPLHLPLDFVTDEARVAVPALREALGIERMVLLGHSVGGAMAVAAAAAFPEDTLAVITVSAQALVEDRTLAGVRDAKARFTAPDQMARIVRRHGNKAAWVLASWIETWLSPAFAAWTIDDELGRLRCPVLAIHGDEDEFGSTRHPERIVSLAPAGSRMRILRGCGHVPHRDERERVLEAVTTFLRDVETEAPADG